jgi:uncharacterized protein YjbI with pentapeptide repeats
LANSLLRKYFRFELVASGEIVLQNIELQNVELQNAEFQKVELQNADYKTLKVTKGRITKC